MRRLESTSAPGRAVMMIDKYVSEVDTDDNGTVAFLVTIAAVPNTVTFTIALSTLIVESRASDEVNSAITRTKVWYRSGIIISHFL